MNLALRLAEKALDKTFPNPMVGAVIVKNGKVIGTGYHRKAGETHAEVKAIESAGKACKGAELFVTLEPCDHYGKTPPCTKAIIESGIKVVNAAMKDPNPINRGRGLEKLRDAGIKVKTGLCGKEAKRLNKKYIKFMTQKIPYVTVKTAQSIDGKIAARDGSSKWISGGIARRYARKMRSGFDAVLIGSNTALKDNPSLLAGGKARYNPARVIVSSDLTISPRSKIIKTAHIAPVIIGTTEWARKVTLEKFRKIKGVEVIITKSRDSRVDLKKFLIELAKKNIVNLLVEGGGELSGSLFDKSLADEVIFFISPKIIGGTYSSVKGRGIKTISQVLNLKEVKIRNIGKDILVQGIVKK